MLASILAVVLSASGAQPVSECVVIPGWEELVEERDPRYIVVGELHGTEEMPAIFADAVCLTAQDAPVAVALEVPSTDQPQINAYLESDGSEGARQALLQTLWFQNTFKDGRSSEAMATLMESLRQMYQAGSITGVTAFQYVGGGSDLSSLDYERALAELVMSSALDGERVLVLVGSTHARTSEVTFGERTYMPMAGHLPREETLSFRIMDNGGDSWNCTGSPIVCGVGFWSGPDEPHARGVRLSNTPDAPWDGPLFLGARTTASPPAE